MIAPKTTKKTPNIRILVLPEKINFRKKVSDAVGAKINGTRVIIMIAPRNRLTIAKLLKDLPPSQIKWYFQSPD
jgi:hypothetical protein